MNVPAIEFRDEALDARTLRTVLLRDGRDLSRAEVLDLLEGDERFREALRVHLAAAPFEAFFWETPAWTAHVLDRPFEHIVKDAPALAGVTADPAPFREHLDGSASVTVFPSLGGDADLVVPRPAGPPGACAHLASFLRTAPSDRVSALFRQVARSLRARLEATGPAPTWLSTSGLGVDWVHVRLDASPKYYTHAPYRNGPAGRRDADR